MKAIVQDTYGSADVLELRDIDKPVARHDDVLLRVHAAGVNPGVWHAMTGRPYVMHIMGFGLRRPKAHIRGTDVAGRVEAVGKDVVGLQPGDEVFGDCHHGSFAEYVCAREDKRAAGCLPRRRYRAPPRCPQQDFRLRVGLLRFHHDPSGPRRRRTVRVVAKPMGELTA